LATCLLVWFSFSLVAPLTFANRQRDLPACCRRDGKHHCSQGREAGGEKSSGTALQLVADRCASWPVGFAVAESGKTFVPRRTAIHLPRLVVAALPAAPASLPRLTKRDGSCFQRGPPAFLA